MTTDTIISKVWSFCTTLRDDGVGYGDYLEQLTYLIFLKMADEYGRPPYKRDVGVPKKFSWATLKPLKGPELEVHYVETLRALGTEKGMLGQIFTKAQNKITDPAKLARLIEMVDATNWVMLDSDVKGDIYEGILEKNAEDTKSGAGQYFTPRALIAAMVECVAPEPGKTIADPACGTGGFFLSAYDYLTRDGNKLNKDEKAFLKTGTFSGNEIVAGTRRLCLMNLFLHNIGEIDGDSLIASTDALVAQPSQTVDYVLANPPFGKKSSMTFTNEEGEQEKDDLTYNRQDFWATTANKQLNFLQHIRSMLKTTGQAAVVLPDNVLFEGGAGETVRKKLMETTELHTILRLPTGIFYAQGVKANVLFFDNRPASKTTATKEVWYYDYRTNIHHTLKRNPLRLENLREFIDCYHPTNRQKRKETWHPEKNPEGRWRKYTYEELAARDKTSLDLFWLKDDSLTDLDNLPEPADLAEEIIENIEAGLNNFRVVAAGLMESLASTKVKSGTIQAHTKTERKAPTRIANPDDANSGVPIETKRKARKVAKKSPVRGAKRTPVNIAKKTVKKTTRRPEVKAVRKIATKSVKKVPVKSVNKKVAKKSVPKPATKTVKATKKIAKKAGKTAAKKAPAKAAKKAVKPVRRILRRK